MHIVTIPCLSDNFAYLVICEKAGVAAAVDPAEADPVLAAIEAEGVSLAAVWNTHHHWDHTGGNDKLAATVPGLEIVAHRSDEKRVHGVTRLVEDGDLVSLGEEVQARIIHNPGHTSGAISYFIESYPAVFTGDTLFIAGCGRLFEGTAQVMHQSLSRLAELPGNTKVFCGHEYTASNLAFAAAVEPDNDRLAARRKEIDALAGKPSVPSTIAEERELNPFLRPHDPSIIEVVRDHADPKDTTPAEIFGALRRWKDGFSA